MNILYLTDNRSEYGMGYYYEDWLAAFNTKFDSMVVFGPGYSTQPEEIPSNIDLVVYGHSFMDVYLRKKFRFFGGRSFQGLDLKKYADVPSILFSKNEYKLMDERIEFISTLDNCLLVCYCRQTLECYRNSYKNIIWAPFGINPQRFNMLNLNRDIDVGMRGNRHGSYIGKLRSNLADSLFSINFLNHDIKLSENGEDFLFGDEYVKWLNNCMFVGNTKSAMNIVNPKFAETLACGAIPISPIDEYEGLLREGEHYIDTNRFLKLSSKSELVQFYQEAKEQMAPTINQYLADIQYARMLEFILDKLNGTYSGYCAIDREV